MVEYTGMIVKKTSTEAWAWIYPLRGTFTGHPTEYRLDAQTYGNEARLINHSDQPNLTAEFVFSEQAWHVIYVAKRPTRKGEQLLVSYGSEYWEGAGKVAL